MFIIVDVKSEEPRPPVSPRGKGKQIEPEEGAKSSGKSLKLNNNSITNLENLIEFAQVKFSDWQSIAWIDLSHNELTKIGPVCNCLNFKYISSLKLFLQDKV